MPPVPKPKHDRRVTRLRQWRKHRDLSQEELADRLEIDRATLSRIERGALPYNQDFLERAAMALGCEPHDILNIDPTAPDAPRLVWSRVMSASPATRDRIIAVIETLLKTGT